MANITSELEIIESQAAGAAVKQAIYDALIKVNAEAEAGGAGITEPFSVSDTVAVGPGGIAKDIIAVAEEVS